MTRDRRLRFVDGLLSSPAGRGSRVRRKLAAMARAGRPGHFDRADAADRVGLEQEHRVEDRTARSGHSSPIVWGDRIFVTAAIEGEVVPGAKAVEAHGRAARSGCIPTASPADKKHTLKVLALDAQDRQSPLGSDRVRGHRL